jgi:hypothetical protein
MLVRQHVAKMTRLQLVDIYAELISDRSGCNPLFLRARDSASEGINFKASIVIMIRSANADNSRAMRIRCSTANLVLVYQCVKLYYSFEVKTLLYRA